MRKPAAFIAAGLVLRDGSVNSSHALLSGAAPSLRERSAPRPPQRAARRAESGSAFDEFLAAHAVLPHGRRERTSAFDLGLHAQQHAEFLGDHPQQQRDCLALGFEPRHRLAQARDITGQHCDRHLEHVVAGDVQHTVGDLLERQVARRMKQSELLDLLVRGEQIALDAVGDELERFGAGPVLVAREPLSDPLRQPRAIDCIDFDEHPGAFQRGDPAGFLRAAIETRQRDEREHALAGGFRVRFERGRAGGAGFAGRQADLDDLPVREERHPLRSGGELRPVEAGIGLQGPRVPRSRARWRGSRPAPRSEQRLVAGDHEHGRQRAAPLRARQDAAERVTLDLHRAGCLSAD
jgi:hypothetical protein